MTSGGALGTAIAGITIDHLGPAGGLSGAIIVIGVGAVVCVTQVQRWHQLID